MILDTTFVIDLLRGREAAVEKLRSLTAAGVPLTIGTPTIFELFSGVEQQQKPAQERNQIHSVIHQQVVWPLDEASAEYAGRIDGHLIATGEQIDVPDAMIAGIALQHHEPILTRNAKHFSRIEGVKVETY